jgi:hypothetical protein
VVTVKLLLLGKGMLEAGRLTVRSMELTYVVGRAVPLKLTVEFLAKPEPVRVMAVVVLAGPATG